MNLISCFCCLFFLLCNKQLKLKITKTPNIGYWVLRIGLYFCKVSFQHIEKDEKEAYVIICFSLFINSDLRTIQSI